MIGAFARMLGTRERLVAYEEADQKHTVKIQGREGVTVAEGRDAPPEAFVERVSHEGGDVFVVPMLEALRELLRRRRSGAAVGEATIPGVSDKR